VETQAPVSTPSPQPQDSAEASPPSAAQLNESAVSRQQSIVAAAREALREARGVPAPVAPPASAGATLLVTPPVAPPVAPAPLLDAAEVFRKEALKMKSEAGRQETCRVA
jgi:hypothetical protein